MSAMAPKTEKDIVICDLDGTLALDHHRNHHLQKTPRDWNTYFSLCEKDEPNHVIIQLIQILAFHKTVYIFTGRRNDYRAETVRWLADHRVPYHYLQMRPVDNRTDDFLLKMQWVKEFEIHSRIWLTIEDRKRVVDAWRANGYPCLQVSPGDS